MMKRRAMVGAVLIACVGSIPQHIAAQQPRALSLDATFGYVYGYTAGEYLNDRQGRAVDLMLGVRSGAAGRRGIVLGANVSLHGDTGPRSLVCYPATTSDGCIQPFPFFHVAGALVGWENASATLRVMGGPAWAHHHEGDALAWQARLDGSAPVLTRLALVGSVRGTLVPRYRGDAVSLFGLGLGVRVR
jgi:hypothetical protein